MTAACMLLLLVFGGCDDEPRRVGECGAPYRVPVDEARLPTRDDRFELELELSELGGVLPVLVVDTHGEPLVDEPKINATLSIHDSMTEAALQELSIDIELRGGYYSMLFDKKQMSIELRDAEGKPVDASLLGMGEDDDWVLSATPMDRSMLKNHVAYELGRRMELESPETRFVELLVNQSGGPLASGDYAGLYLLVEKLTRNRTRLGIDEAAGGFLVELTTIDTVWPDEPYLCTAWASQPAVVKYPKDASPGSPAFRSIERRIYKLEHALFEGSEKALRAVLDVDAAADFWLLNEALMNEDAFARSVFLHAGSQGKLVLGPVWDFDTAMRSSLQQLMINNGNKFGWARGLVRHRFFRELVATRWHTLRVDSLSDASIIELIDASWDEIADAAARNDAKWRLWEWKDGEAGSPEDEKEGLKAWLLQRFAWFDAHIDGLEAD